MIQVKTIKIVVVAAVAAVAVIAFGSKVKICRNVYMASSSADSSWSVSEFDSRMSASVGSGRP